jgi:hypothetical protein
MRKMMTKEVTATKVQVAKMVLADGMPKAERLPVLTLLGNVNLEKAQKEAVKQLGAGVTVFSVEPETKVYEMPVEEFIKVASLKVDEPEQTEAELV